MVDKRVEKLAKLFVSYSVGVRQKEKVIIQGTAAILSKHSVSYKTLVPEIEKVKRPTGIISPLGATVGILVRCSAILSIAD